MNTGRNATSVDGAALPDSSLERTVPYFAIRGLGGIGVS